MVDRLNANGNGYSITDEVQTDVGSSAFGLDHDTFYTTNFEIWTGSGRSGTQLTEGTDYNLVNEDTRLTDKYGSTVYTQVEVTTSTYQTGDLYFYYTTVGDYNEAFDINQALKASGTSFEGFDSGYVRSLQGKLEENYVSVKDFGAKGDSVTDDTDELNNAFQTAKTKNKNIYIPNGVFKVNDEIELPKDINVIGNGSNNSIIDASGATGLFPNSAVLYNSGNELISLPNLANNVTAGDTQINFSLEPNVEEGDIIILYNPTDYSYSSSRSYYRKGEYLKVWRKSSTDPSIIELASPVIDDYDNSNIDVYKMEGTNSKINDIGVIAPNNNGVQSIRIERGVRNELTGTKALNSDDKGIALVQCYNTRIRAKSYQYQDSGLGTQYGLVVSNSQFINIEGFFVGQRHPVATGGGDRIGGVPNRFIDVHDSTLIGIESFGADFHGNTEYSQYNNCLIFGAYTPTGNHNVLKNSKVIGNPRNNNGVCVYARELKGFDHTIENCEFHTEGNPQDGSRHVIDIGGNSAPLNSNTTESGTFHINNVTINAPNFTGNAVIGYNNRGCTLQDLVIKLNDVNVTAPNGGLSVVNARAVSGEPFYKLINENMTCKDLDLTRCSDIVTKIRGHEETGIDSVTTQTNINYIAKTINFDKEFPKPPHVNITLAQSTTGGDRLIAYITSVGTTSFDVDLRTVSGNNFSGSVDVGFHWGATIKE